MLNRPSLLPRPCKANNKLLQGYFKVQAKGLSSLLEGKVPCRMIPLSQMSKTSGRRQPKRTVANSKERNRGSHTRRNFLQAFLSRIPPGDNQDENSSCSSPWLSRSWWRRVRSSCPSCWHSLPCSPPHLTG